MIGSGRVSLALIALALWCGVGASRLPNRFSLASRPRSAHTLRLRGGSSAAPGSSPGSAPGGSDQGAAALQGLLGLLGGLAPSTPTGSQAPPPLVSDDTPNFGVGMSRSMRAMAVYNEIKAEYDAFEKRNFTCSKEKTARFHELHNRSAYKCLDLARENGGIYNKAAQFAASLQGGAGERGIPEEYIKALRVCTDHAPGQPFSKIDAVIIEEFGMSGRQLFRQIDEVPIAAASLGQVHRAVCKDGTEVAVKIIYPELRRELASDFAVFKTLGSQIKPGGFDLQWLVKDFEDALKKELDFEGEARNAERCREMLSHLSNVRVPRVLWNFTRKSVVTTEFQGGLIRVDDHQAIREAGLSRDECGSLISDVFNEMAFCKGIVHGDPHMGNVYVRALESSGGSRGGSSKAPELVILDHGLYHEIDSNLRVDLCNLMLACIERQSTKTQELASKLAGPLHRFLPLLMSPLFVFNGQISFQDLMSAYRGQIPNTVSLKDVGSTIEALHQHGGSILGVLHSFGYTRGLLKALDYPERQRLKSVATFAVMGLLDEEKRGQAVVQRMTGMPADWGQAVMMAKFQVDVTYWMVPALILWRLLRPAIIGLQGFAFLALVNILGASATKLLNARV